MARVLVLVLLSPFAWLIAAGCQPTMPPPSLKYSEPFTCEPRLTDIPCIACLKEKCCAPARVCTFKKGQCPCSIKCLPTNTLECAAACSDPDDKAVAMCAATACAGICPGTGGTI